MEVDVAVYGDRMEVAAGGQSVTAVPAVPYVGRRVLVGSFEPAVACLRQGLREIGATGALKLKPILTIRAMEMNEGRLSEVESRCLYEVGLMAGARRVEVR
jgi:hypothetical protein